MTRPAGNRPAITVYAIPPDLVAAEATHRDEALHVLALLDLPTPHPRRPWWPIATAVLIGVLIGLMF